MKKLISFTLFAALLLVVAIAQKTRLKELPAREPKTVAIIREGNSL